LKVHDKEVQRFLENIKESSLSSYYQSLILALPSFTPSNVTPCMDGLIRSENT
jgi:hypothetical protein